ncbi:MAG: B-box zinc finger protein [Armatimonadota bacterium]|nr:B-box zinc finger protein [Armatimonadota bacterium]MDR7401944.1 B-box zinc finger protein [Armatimonadota bacterium]MDR7403675.1 B-box zinc finger protein [Armatimonadota bacterium]MDR7437284.1 B-box zinc finger protein [Armatimonadota bacterium]MDR7471505.1 B-box zinc finger protein [Armatimonadota bacterium]
MRCAAHPGVETELTCASCGRPICPDCLVQTPVGMKCRDCGLAPPPPLYRASPGALATGIVVAALLGGAAGLAAWWAAQAVGWLVLLAGPALGGLVGDAAWRAARRRGRAMAAAVAAACAAGVVVVGPQAAALAGWGTSLGAGDLLVLLIRRPLLPLMAVLMAVAAFWRVR